MTPNVIIAQDIVDIPFFPIKDSKSKHFYLILRLFFNRRHLSWVRQDIHSFIHNLYLSV